MPLYRPFLLLVLTRFAVTRRAKAKQQDAKPSKSKSTENEAAEALPNAHDSNVHHVTHDETRTLLSRPL